MKYCITILFIFVSFLATAQDEPDANVFTEDSISVFKFNRAESIPKRSALYSALLPGLGQVYNKQYWKLGLVAGGLGAAGYFIYFNNTEYNRFRRAYILRIDNNENTKDEFDIPGGYSAQDLNTLQNQYRQYLEYSIIFTTVGYAINILDAYVAAHLRSFDISDDISFKAKPTFNNRQLGMAVVLKF